MDRKIIFSTRFPDYNEMKSILNAGIMTIYFFGPIDDPKTVQLVNDINSKEVIVEMTQLEL